MKRHAEAYQYLRLGWRPKVGDRVLFQGKRSKVVRVKNGRGVKLEGRNDYLLPGQVLWRPTPCDFDALLLNFNSLFVYRQLIVDNRQVVGIPCNGRVIPVRGRPMQILSALLRLRSIDSKLSVTINRVFEKSYEARLTKPKAEKVEERVRLHILNTTEEKSSDPS